MMEGRAQAGPRPGRLAPLYLCVRRGPEKRIQDEKKIAGASPRLCNRQHYPDFPHWT
jgi:hypothetical protein